VILNEEKVSEWDQLWVTDDTQWGESIRVGSALGYRRYSMRRKYQSGISCGLPTILNEEKVSEWDQLWVTNDTQWGESIRVGSSIGYRRYSMRLPTILNEEKVSEWDQLWVYYVTNYKKCMCSLCSPMIK
jgi:hypothetical protein